MVQSCIGWRALRYGAGRLGGDTGTPQRALSRRGVGHLPRFRLQLGNLLASANAAIQAAIAVHYGNDYALTLTLVVVIVAMIIAAMTGFGAEAKDVAFGRGRLQVRRPASGGT